MARRLISLAALAGAAAVAGCTSAARPAPAARPTEAATASASIPAGCAQAAAAVTAAREQINAQDFSGATTRIADLRDTLPGGKLKVDAALAATKLAFLSYDVTTGNPIYQDIKDVLASLDTINADCAP